jgi:hypothetical protein
MSELAHRAAGAWPARPHGALREQRSQRKHTLQNEPGNAAKLRFFFNALTWLACQDSNLGMEESKSAWFALCINAYSEKSRRFALNAYKRLADISECRTGPFPARPDSRGQGDGSGIHYEPRASRPGRPVILIPAPSIL